jgi:hypothetical protein
MRAGENMRRSGVVQMMPAGRQARSKSVQLFLRPIAGLTRIRTTKVEGYGE